MPRQNRVAVSDVIYHVINRANGRVRIFSNDKEYQHFESLLQEGVTLTGMRILAYCVMPNHFHLLLYPTVDGQMSEFMRWITTTHVRQRRVATKSIGDGHLYQGTYKSFPVEANTYFLHLLRYIEQNPLRAGLVKRAEEWKWSSLYRREKGSAKEKKLLTSLPVDLPRNYLKLVNELGDAEGLEKIRYSIEKGAPYGSMGWTEKMVEKYSLENTQRGPGRPKRK